MGALPGLDFRSARRRRRKRGSRGRVRGAPRSDQRRGPFPAPASDLYFFPAPSLGVGACRSGASRAGSALRRTVRSRRLSRGPSRRCPRSDRRRASALRSPPTRADVVAQRASTGLPRRCLRSDPRYPSRPASYAFPQPSPRSDRRRASALRPPLTLALPVTLGMRLLLGPGGLRAPPDGTGSPGVARSILWVSALRFTVPCLASARF